MTRARNGSRVARVAPPGLAYARQDMSANGHYCIMGIGDMGFHIAEAFGREGRSLTLIDIDPDKGQRIEEELDASFVVGNGAHQAVLERAHVDAADLFIAASSSEEANLVASVIARNLGAKRCVVRLDTSEDLTVYRRSYERLFGADLLLSPQSLATNAILNVVLGHHTYEVDYLAKGRFELRTNPGAGEQRRRQPAAPGAASSRGRPDRRLLRRGARAVDPWAGPAGRAGWTGDGPVPHAVHPRRGGVVRVPRRTSPHRGRCRRQFGRGRAGQGVAERGQAAALDRARPAARRVPGAVVSRCRGAARRPDRCRDHGERGTRPGRRSDRSHQPR